MKKIAHSSALGLANEPASLLAAELVEAANLRVSRRGEADSPSQLRTPHSAAEQSFLQRRRLDRAGSRAQAGLRIHPPHARAARPKPRFLSLDGAYHGDTVGAVSLGHIDLFHKAYGGLLFKTDKVMAPYCYRCPFNRAKPERADAREYRKCNWECVGKVEQKFSAQKKRGNPYAAFVFEPLMQGAAGMIPQPTAGCGGSRTSPAATARCSSRMK